MLDKGRSLSWFSLVRERDSCFICKVRAVDMLHALLNFKKRASFIGSSLDSVEGLRDMYLVYDSDMNMVWKGTLQSLICFRYLV